MNLKIEMYDMETNELLAHRYCEYQCNFMDKNDSGFKTLLAWCRSAVRGVRVKHLPAVELKIQFLEPTPQPDLFGGVSRDKFNEQAEAFLV